MKAALFTLLLGLSACASTAEMASEAPAKVYHSRQGRDAVAECLLNRVSSDELTPKKQVDGAETTVGFTGRGGLAAKPGIYLFTIRDEGSGSVTEARRFAHASLANAETCF